MALALHQPRTEPDATTISLCLGSAGRILEALGGKTHEGGTLNQLAATDPTVLKRWATSTSKAPAGVEKRLFAKMVLSCVDAGVHLGVDRHPLAADAAPAAVPPEPHAFTRPAAEVVRLRAAAAVTRIKTVPLVISAGSTFVQAAYSWAPRATTLGLAFMALTIVKFPDLVVIVPVKVVIFCWSFVLQLVSRFWARLEMEANTMMSPAPALLDASTGANPTTPVVYVQQQPSQHVALLGWAAAAFAYFRQ